MQAPRDVLRPLIVACLSLGFLAPASAHPTIYWTDIGAGKVQRLNDDSGLGIEDLVTAQAMEPVDIALDLTNGKLYWTEASPADFMISRANLDGTNVELQLQIAGLTRPSGIALDISSAGPMVPAVSQWGIIVAMLAVLASGTVVLRRIRAC